MAGYHGMGMAKSQEQPLIEQRRLVQRILSGRIPSGRELDVCREILTSECEEPVAFQALFTLLRGALADPLFNIDDTQLVVPLLKALARGDLTAGDLL
jgi:hypothetical protein